MSQAVFGKGTLIKRSDSGVGAPFSTVVEVKSIEGPTMSAAILDVTTHDTAGFWIEQLSGLLNPGNISFRVNFVPDHAMHNGQTGLIADFAARTKRDYALVFPNIAQTTWTFRCQVTGCPISAPVDNVLESSITLTILEPPTLT
jgi:predicted secreted protein